MDAIQAACLLFRYPSVAMMMDVLGYFGHGAFAVPLALLLIAVGFARNQQHLKLAGIAVLISITAAGLITHLLKLTVQWPRPRATASYGFPSGHTGSAFGLATSLSVAFPAVSPLVFLLATLTAVSRMYFRAHYVIDVIGGAIIGSLAGFLVSKKIIKPAERARFSGKKILGWSGVAIIALGALLFFYRLEQYVQSYKSADATAPNAANGVVVDFGTAQVRPFLGQGWSGDELWMDGELSVVWAVGRASELSVDFASANLTRWSLHLFPYAGKGPACQIVDVSVNQAAVAKLLLEPGWHWYEIEIPPGLVRTGRNAVQFFYDFAESPQSRGKSRDPRILSVAFDKLEALPGD